MEVIIGQIILFIISVIAKLGYGGVVFLMVLESANIPIPSEIILPFAGFLAYQGRLNFHLAALAGGLGCLLGSWLSYWLGVKLGRPLLLRYGKWLLISPHDLEVSESWIAKYGNAVFFFSRLLPVVRTFISLGGGITRAAFWTFSIYTLIGSWLWSYLLVYVGFLLGENWEQIYQAWHKFDYLIIFLVAVLLIAYLLQKIFRKNK